MRGMLVAAGYGTRLSPLTDELPKPAVPVANRPLGAFALSHLVASGVSDVVANSHHLAPALEAALRPWVPAGAQLSFAHEPEILGTGGGVKHAWRRPQDGPFIVMNGKLLFQPDLAHALSVHLDTDALATLVLGPMPAGEPFGPVDIDQAGAVRAVLERQLAPGRRRCFFTGVYILHPRAHAMLPDRGCLIRQGVIPWIAGDERVMGVVDEHPFADPGRSLQHYHAANMELLDGRRRFPGVTPEPRTASLVAADAQLAPGCALDHVAVGAGAVVDAARLQRVVVWPGAQVREDLTDAIVTTAGRIVRL